MNRMAAFRAFLSAILFTAALGAETASTVNALVAALRTAISKHEPDPQIARYIQKVKLTESLDDTTIEQLESAGVGPKGVEALETLRDASRTLPPPKDAVPGFEAPPAPGIDDLRHILAETRKQALAYNQTLPDFICTQTVRRYLDPKATNSWKETDTLTVKLSYYQQKEDYQLQLINGKPAAKTYEATGGAVSKGEFGSMLLEIFDPATGAAFRWDHWTMLRKRKAIVLSYRIAMAKSHYQIVYDGGGERLTVTAGQHGFVYIDAETNAVLRLKREAEGLPGAFPIKKADSMVDYDFTSVGGRQFLLPLRAEVRMLSETGQNRNVVEFRDYRKFSGESSISFELKDK